MTTTARTWIAGTALAFSALVLSASADPRGLAVTGSLALAALLGHVWSVAIGERVGSERGGLEVPRCPLATRVLSTEGVTVLLVLLALVVGLATRSLVATGIGLAAVLVVSVDMLRRWLPVAGPALFALWALLTMAEFHTLGDLLETARAWCMAAGVLLVWVVVLSGPLLRTDVGGRLSLLSRLAVVAAGLPGYALGFWVFTRSPLAGVQADLLALGLGLLAGGAVQSLVLGLLGRASELRPRSPADYPPVDGTSLAHALVPLVLPVLCVLSIRWLPLPAGWEAVAAPAAWAGLLVLALVVPATPAAVVVAAALDRVDGRTRGRLPAATGWAALAVWFVVGPGILATLYADGGWAAAWRERFPVPGGALAVTAGHEGSAVLGGTALGGSLTLWGLPAADLCRGATVLLGLTAALAARLVRHADRSLHGVRPGLLVVLVTLAVALCWLLQPRMGPLGAVAGAALACVVLLIADTLAGERVREEEGPWVPLPGAQPDGPPGPASVPLDEAPPQDEPSPLPEPTVTLACEPVQVE